jgi:hypothetical protein
MILELEKTNKELFLSKDVNNREIYFFNLKDVQFVGQDLYYPNVFAFSRSDNNFYRVIREKIMSLKNIKDINFNFKKYESKHMVNQPVFYFIYNTDNYYHFIYDTLPYIISFNKIKEKIPSLKLLMNYPNKEKNTFYKFVEEFLYLLNIKKEDILIISPETIYSNVYFSSSYTHDIDSNLPPRKEIYEFYKSLTDQIKNEFDLPKKIYISRRTWTTKDHSNIGTNYTTRRKLINEDELVLLLQKHQYREIFTENLSTKEKILLFKNASNIIGAFGGGICNVLFSDKNPNLTAIESPGFLDVNNRFIYSLKNTNLKIFKDTEHIEKTKFKKYMRVQYGSIIGEIIEVNKNFIELAYTDDFVAGWNYDLKLKNIKVDPKLCKILDNGLNSNWKINIKKFKNEVLGI